MAAMFRVDPRLAQRIDECRADGSVLVEASRRGTATVSMTSVSPDVSADDSPGGHRRDAGATPAGAATLSSAGPRRLYLHSRIDPEEEARRFAESVETGNDLCYIVGGFGLGHHLRALHSRLKGEAFLVVIEPSLPLLKAALETVDLAELFAADRCIILTRVDKAELQERLEAHNVLMMMGARFVSHPPSERVAGEFQAVMRKLLADHMSFCRMSLVTLVAHSRITCRNVANNLPAYVSTPPIDMLRDRFQGYPGVVVAAGPSLRRNIDQLAQLQGRAVICCVQTTFKTLLDRGIVPDFTTSLDYHEMSKRFFEGISRWGPTHLVAEPKATWHVIDSFDGPISLLNNDFARLCLGDELAARGGLKSGATVAHLAFYLAVYLGCDPIILVGQDLGYTNHVYYMPGVPIHDLWRPELNRFNTMEMREWERIVRNRPILRRVHDVAGHEIYSDEQLFTYLQQFEGDFAAVPGRVIDATEGGVRKAGTQVMTLAAVAERYCRNPIPLERFAYREQVRWRDSSRLAQARREIRQRIEEVRRLAATCHRMLRVLRDLKGLLNRPAVFNRRIKEVDKLRAEVRAQERIYAMASAVSQTAELQRFSADRRLGLASLEGTDRARWQLNRDVRFVEAVIEGTDALQQILDESLQRFDAALDRAEPDMKTKRL